MVQEIQDGGVSGLWRDDSREILAVSVPNQTILTFGLQLIRYLKAEEFHYSSATWFLLTQYIGFPWLQLLYRRLRRFILNLRPLTRIDRTRVLQSYVEKSLSSDESRMSSVALMTMLYGPRWAHHPDNDRLRRYYEIVLESLAQTGELTHDGHAYRLAAQGFATLTQYEENAQRYRDMVRMQWLLAALTLGLVFVGLIQAAITYLGQD